MSDWIKKTLSPETILKIVGGIVLIAIAWSELTGEQKILRQDVENLKEAVEYKNNMIRENLLEIKQDIKEINKQMKKWDNE